MDIGFKLDTKAIQKDLDKLDKDFQRATMYAIRAAGRVGKQEAKKNAPVSSYEYRANGARIKRGRLRDSIRSSKKLKKNGPKSYTVYVAPWGNPVYLYRGKVNAEYHFMDKAFAAVEGKMAKKFEQAYTNVLKKRGRV